MITRVRNAFASILDALPGQPTRPQDVARSLGLHRKLGWQISKLVCEPDPFAAIQHLPGPVSVKRFLAAARAHDISDEIVAAARGALRAYDGLVERHAGDRGSLEIMLAGCAGEASVRRHLVQRKAMYAAGSFFWGVQARTCFHSFILHPAQRPGWFDVACLIGLIEFRRVRSDVKWPLAITKRRSDDDTEVEQPLRQPLAPLEPGADVLSAPPLLKRFCSTPLPDVRRTVCADGWVLDEILGGPVGQQGALNCITGEVFRRACPCYRTEHSWIWGATIPVRTPARALLLDQFVHEDLFGQAEPEFHAYRDLDVLGRRAALQQRHADRIPVFESVDHLGRGLGSAWTPDVPHYLEMVQSAFELLGWDPARFHHYRVGMEYPPLPTTVAMEIALPDRPAGAE